MDSRRDAVRLFIAERIRRQAIGEWLVHSVAGLAPGPDAPAYRHVVFRPQPGKGLTSASATLETPYGPTGISWKHERGILEGELIIPPNAFADFEFLSPGSLIQNGTRHAGKSGGKFRLSPGTASFRLRVP